MMPPSIYAYVKSEEARFETDEIQVGDNWNWNFRKHVQLIFHLVHGVFYTGENNYLRAFKQVMRPMIQLAKWTEDLEVKDVLFFTEDGDNRVLSFLVKKYHDEKYVREHDIDTLFDEITENDLTYGGALIQPGKKRPELLKLNKIAFADQTDILGGPIGFKYYFSPSKLRKMSKAGWGNPENGATVTIDELITLATFEKDPAGTVNEKNNKTPGKNIETYIVRGDLPNHYLLDNDDLESFTYQLQVIAYYTNKEGKKEGVTLYRKKASEEDLLFHTSEPVTGRALGYSDGEAHIHPQIWTNFLSIHKMGQLEAASKILPYTDDESFDTKQNLSEVENLQLMKVAEGRTFGLVPTVNPNSLAVIDNAVSEWYQQSQLLGSAFDPVLGKEASSGTTFRGQERVVAQGKGLHDQRRGKRAKFIEILYRKRIIPDIVSEIIGGTKFLATLTTEELAWVTDQLATKEANRRIKKKMIEEGKIISKEERDLLKEEFKKSFAKKGNKHLLEILENEFEGIELQIGINVAGKQKDLALLSDKLLSIFQFVFTNPQAFQSAMQVPALAKSFSDILEFSGISQADFSTLMAPPEMAMAPAQPQAPAAPMALNAPTV